jgi:hypothetical protein
MAVTGRSKVVRFFPSQRGLLSGNTVNMEDLQSLFVSDFVGGFPMGIEQWLNNVASTTLLGCCISPRSVVTQMAEEAPGALARVGIVMETRRRKLSGSSSAAYRHVGLAPCDRLLVSDSERQMKGQA